MRFKRALTAAFAGAALAGAIAAPALAESENVGGGTWNYGVNKDINFSHYYHPDNCHTATVTNNNGTDWDDATAGNWAEAEIESTWWGNEAYWNNEC